MIAQHVYIALVIINLFVTAARDGKPRTGKYSFACDFVALLVGAALLWWGGWFAPLLK